jgi:hypothetical protein
MKAVGLALIVYGHVAAASSAALTPPVYPKQLGVAFFVFAMGFTLSLERRPWHLVVYRRVFEVLLFGIAAALALSIVGLVRSGDPSESNYLPLLGGLHLIQNDFPANPTTWYIGTYFHLLLFWAVVLRRVVPSSALLMVLALTSIAVRAIMLLMAQPFVAYMALTNWLDLMVLGMLAGRCNWRPPPWAATVAPLLIVAWPFLLATVDWHRTFPFMAVSLWLPIASVLTVSILVSVAYLSYTCAAFAVALRLPQNRFTTFVARNTLIVFIAHMPAYYLLESLLADVSWPYFARTGLEFVVCFFGLSFASEVVRSVVRPERLREQMAQRLGWA